MNNQQLAKIWQKHSAGESLGSTDTAAHESGKDGHQTITKGERSWERKAGEKEWHEVAHKPAAPQKTQS